MWVLCELVFGGRQVEFLYVVQGAFAESESYVLLVEKQERPWQSRLRFNLFLRMIKIEKLSGNSILDV